jgi:flagellar hook assembly protein FlgD
MSYPASFSLGSPYPNPFNAVTTLPYELPKATHVKMVIYDVLGQEVSSLSSGPMEAGHHQLQWKGLDAKGQEVPSGIYIARLVTPEHSRSVKLVLLK